LNERRASQALMTDPSGRPVFWRVEGSLLGPSPVRAVAPFTWDAQSFSGRWLRRGAYTAILTTGAKRVGRTHRQGREMCASRD